MKRMHLFIPEEQINHVDLLARNRGISKSEMLRVLITKALARHPISKENPIEGHPTTPNRS